MGAGVAGVVFFLLNRPQGGSIIILVPSPTPPGLVSDVSVTPEGQLININLASVELLAVLPGIGEKRAQAIVDYRNQMGPFHRIDEMMKVEGIGPTTYQGLRHLVTVGEAP